MNYFDAEIAVAGALLLDAEKAYPLAAKVISADCFSQEPCRAIFTAAGRLLEEGKTADPVTIKERAKQDGTPLENETLMQYMDLTPTAANVEAHAAIVQTEAKKRSLKNMAQNILETVDTAAIDTLVSDSLSGLQDLVEGTTAQQLVGTMDAVTSLMNSLADKAKGKRSFVPSGFPRLDKALGGGFVNGGLYILAARPGMGKTTLAVNLLDRFPGPVLFVSLEMTPEQVTAKRLSRAAGIPYNELAVEGIQGRGDAATEKWTRLWDAVGVLKKDVTINHRPSATVSQIRLWARSLKQVDAIIIDYLGLVQAEVKGSRYEQVSAISRALKELALSLNVPVIALAQLNRETERNGSNDHHPKLSDIRDSGAIEQDADAVLLLYRPDYYSQSGEPQKQETPSLIELQVAKNRHGFSGAMIHYEAFLSVNRIEEIL